MWPYALGLAIVGLLAYSLRRAPPPQNAKPSKDIKLPTAEEGTEYAVLFGKRRVKGYPVIWHGNLDVDPIKQKGGKK